MRYPVAMLEQQVAERIVLSAVSRLSRWLRGATSEWLDVVSNTSPLLGPTLRLFVVFVFLPRDLFQTIPGAISCRTVVSMPRNLDSDAI